MDHKERQQKQFDQNDAETRKNLRQCREELAELTDKNTAKDNLVRQLKKNLKEIKRFLTVKTESLEHTQTSQTKGLEQLEILKGKNLSLIEEISIVKENNDAFKQAHQKLSGELAHKISQISKFESMIARIKQSRALRKRSDHVEQDNFDEEEYLVLKHEHNRLEVSHGNGRTL